MAERDVITAEEMDRMTPAERAAAVEAGTVLDLDELPAEFRSRVEARAERLTAKGPFGFFGVGSTTKLKGTEVKRLLDETRFGER